MLDFIRRKKPTDLINLDWERILKELQACDPKDGSFYIITVNKGKEDEYRTRFMTHQETLEIVMLALEKKGLRVPVQL